MSPAREHHAQVTSMDTVGGHRLRAAGVEWDAVRVPRCLGVRVLDLLGSRSGAVAEDPYEPALYWFVPAGTAPVWHLPGTRALGLTQHLVVPAPHRLSGPGPHWRIAPVGTALLTDTDVLRDSIEAATAPLWAPTSETT